jgi:hypothetical protein
MSERRRKANLSTSFGADVPAEIVEQGTIVRNEVHRLYEIIFDRFSRRGVAPEDFQKFASVSVIDAIEDISKSEDAPKQVRLDTLKVVYAALVEAIERLEQPDLPSERWSERSPKRRSDDPFEWVKSRYPSYGNGLTQAQIHRHDPGLYRRLHQLKAHPGWPPDFDLPSAREHNDAQLASLGGQQSPKDSAYEPPSDRRSRERLRSAERYRRRHRSE